MSLPLLVAIVAVGITLTVLAVHLTGGAEKARISNPGQALARFADDYPEETPLETLVTADGTDAFLPLPGGRVGIVHGVGQHFLTRVISARDVKRLAVDRFSLALQLDDFGWTGGTFVFRDEADAQRIAGLLTAAAGHDQQEAA